MGLKKFKMVLGGTATLMASLLATSTSAYSVAKSDLAIGRMDGWFEVNRDIWETRTVKGVREFTKDYASLTEFADALIAHCEKQGEEGFALLQNENNALPLAAGANVTLFGNNCFNMPNGHTGINANNNASSYKKFITLAEGLAATNKVTINDTVVAADFPGRMASAPNNFGSYTIPEQFSEKDTWVIPSNSIGIVTVGRGGAEGANYKPDSASNAVDPLALSDQEIAMIDYARSHCDKVVVLVVSANAMELGPIVKGGDHEVDAIGFCGIPNDYQYGGIAKVLVGLADATGGLTDTYLYDNSFNPATINMGQQQYQDKDSIALTQAQDPYHRASRNYAGNNYIVEAEGIYVGYKYYETRYFDSVNDPTGTNAKDTIGSSKAAQAWDYKNEVVFPFGKGLSYVPYEQEVLSVNMDVSENGKTTAVVKVTNKGTRKAKFNTQLYVSKPYTAYDKENKIEKSAIDFLNSAKVEVEAGQSKEVEISLPTRYLASWDSKGAKTYIMDAGDYLFTAANGAHEAVNNVLKQLGKTTDGGEGTGKAVKVNLAQLDKTSFAHSNGHVVTNVADDADINYYLPDKVTYLSRADWRTYPKNYTNFVNGSGIESEPAFKIEDSAKKDEWLKNLRNLQYIGTYYDQNNRGEPCQNVEGILPDNVGEGKEFANMWDWITSFKINDPEAFKDVNSEIWETYAQAININEAVGAILHGGNTTDTLSVGNPTSAQSESVAGYEQSLTIIPEDKDNHIDAKKLKLNLASNTLLGASFNPQLAYEWGKIEGECSLWLMDEQNKGPITVWGGGLNLHRSAYNGRNSEYMSEDPMLTNRIGAAQYEACMTKGAINGPKHMGFNDQELNRRGNACYMTEQKMRETDIRCYEGALRAEEGNGNGVMMSYARIGAQNVTNMVGLQVEIMRGEWAFDGIITTDFGSPQYHEPYSIINATTCQYAGFGANDSFIGANGHDFSDTAADKTFSYITMAALKADNYICEKARLTNKYQQFTLANSANYNLRKAGEGEEGEDVELNVYVGRLEHAPWETIFDAATITTAILTGIAGVAFLAACFLPGKKEI
jgi:beta-glucosidase